MSDTKAANLRLESEAYSLLHFLSAAEQRSKADIVSEALNDYAARNRDRLQQYAGEVAAAAGIALPRVGRTSRSRSDVLAMRVTRGSQRDLIKR